MHPARVKRRAREFVRVSEHRGSCLTASDGGLLTPSGALRQARRRPPCQGLCGGLGVSVPDRHFGRRRAAGGPL